MYATEKQNRGSDCSLIVVSLTTENNRIIHIRKAVAFSDFTFLLQAFWQSPVNTLTRPDPARVYRTCTKRISLESSLKELSFKTITKSMGVSMKELWTEMCVLKKNGISAP